VNHLQQTQEQTGVSLAQQCRQIGVPCSTVRRWIRRSRRGQPLVNRPGPAPVELIDWGRVFDDILAMRHGRERTPGVAALWDKYGGGISRRDLQALVAQGRAIQAQEKADAALHVHWHMPGIIWSIDTTELKDPETGRKVYIHTVQDLGSRYKFDTLSGTDATGEAIAKLLERLFIEFGPPLVCKRDLGSNLCCSAVDDLFARYGVIPLDSPPACPRYNGAIEHAQGEIQVELEHQLREAPTEGRLLHIRPYVDCAMHVLNHKERRSLDDKNACPVFHSGSRHAMISLRKRKEVTDEIIHLTIQFLDGIADATVTAARRAWRLAVETWLVDYGAISLSKDRVLPDFLEPMRS
jgi:transposase InsO family protein